MGVQDVHCVMHKCIMVKVWGSEKHKKYVKSTEILRNQGEIWKSSGEQKFSETEEKCIETVKIGGNRNL